MIVLLILALYLHTSTCEITDVTFLHIRGSWSVTCGLSTLYLSGTPKPALGDAWIRQWHAGGMTGRTLTDARGGRFLVGGEN